MADTTRTTRSDHRRARHLLAALALAVTALGLTVAPGAGPASADGNEAPGAPPAFRSLTAGDIHTCVVLGGTVRCWGWGASGQLGTGTSFARGNGPLDMGAFLTPAALGAGRTATAVTAGAEHTCALLDNSTIKCWGQNADGQLGQGDTTDRGDNANEMGDNLPAVSLGSGRTATAVAAGANHTCALLDNGTVKCWGRNGNGQLGLGDTTQRGDEANEMGGSLLSVSLGTGRTATAVAAGTNHTCALLDDATVKCWGGGIFGQLGLGDIADRGNQPNEMGDALPAVDLGPNRTATAISAGEFHTCALLDNGNVKCWGNNADGQLGQGDTANRGDAPGEMGTSLPPVSLGANRTATAVTTGGSHTCALLDNANVKCWGDNAFGQLGQGDTANRGDAAGEMGGSLPPVALGSGRTVLAVSSGEDHVCAVLDNATLKCWGDNFGGILGSEDSLKRGDGPGEMGDNLPVVFLPPAGTLNGTVRDAVSNDPIPGAMVVALRTSDFGLAASAIADANGDFQTHAPPGDYFYYLLDPEAGHDDGFFGAPLTITVFDGSNSTLPLTMEPLRGAFSGTVTDQATGAGIGSVQVYAIGTTGLVRAATTAFDGTYTVADLPVGTYHAVFVDGAGRRLAEYWPDSPDFGGSDPFNVTAGDTTTGIDAALFKP
ncbi:MAG: carboxypeptidase regulatory-like domain-containing protein [Microthrixaceae bacterium]|nr:carboxypeptidase regulatory-like domain-containing protein [Microthrixaceae bacterium]